MTGKGCLEWYGQERVNGEAGTDPERVKGALAVQTLDWTVNEGEVGWTGKEGSKVSS